MRYRTLDVVVLDRELPDRGLRKGDLGAVVEVYEPDGLEVEFVTASGRTEALLTLGVADVRPVADNDLVAVRPYRPNRSEEHTSELQSRLHLVCRLLLEKKKNITPHICSQRAI